VKSNLLVFGNLVKEEGGGRETQLIFFFAADERMGEVLVAALVFAGGGRGGKSEHGSDHFSISPVGHDKKRKTGIP